MKILTNGSLVDFETPIQMQEDQFQEFTIFLGELLNETIEVHNTTEKERFTKNFERHPRKWEAEELFLLLNHNLDNSELSKRLKRSETSVAMHRANFVPSFVSWAKSKGFDASKISKTLVEQFIGEKNDNS